MSANDVIFCRDSSSSNSIWFSHRISFVCFYFHSVTSKLCFLRKNLLRLWEDLFPAPYPNTPISLFVRSFVRSFLCVRFVVNSVCHTRRHGGWGHQLRVREPLKLRFKKCYAGRNDNKTAGQDNKQTRDQISVLSLWFTGRRSLSIGRQWQEANDEKPNGKFHVVYFHFSPFFYSCPRIDDGFFMFLISSCQ
jgi:hypothetical protein